MKKSRLSEHARLSDYLWVLLFSAYSLLPVLWVVMTSLKTNQELVRMARWRCRRRSGLTTTWKPGTLRGFPPTLSTAF